MVQSSVCSSSSGGNCSSCSF